MAQVLSQDEIDALLRGVADEEVETEQIAPTEELNLQTFDILSQEGFIRGRRMAGLEMIHERFARTFRSSLSGLLTYPIDISNVTTDMMKFGDFLKMLPVPSSLHILKFNPLSRSVLLVLETKLVFTLIDIFFGGKGDESVKIEGREFTNIEHSIILKIVRMIIKDLNTAWNSIHPIDIEYKVSEINPQFVNIVPPIDTVITVTFEVEFEYSTGSFTICIPYSVIEPLKEQLSSGYQEDEGTGVNTEWLNRLRGRVVQTELDMKFELGRATIKAGDLMKLKIGDVIMLDSEVGLPLEGLIENVPKIKVSPGVVKSNRAVVIKDFIPMGRS